MASPAGAPLRSGVTAGQAPQTLAGTFRRSSCRLAGHQTRNEAQSSGVARIVAGDVAPG
jgi:hypothetical protein